MKTMCYQHLGCASPIYECMTYSLKCNLLVISSVEELLLSLRAFLTIVEYS